MPLGQNCSGILFNCYRYSIATAEEWSKLMQFYEADYPIIIKKTDNDYQTNPGEYKIFRNTRDKRWRWIVRDVDHDVLLFSLRHFIVERLLRRTCVRYSPIITMI